MAFTGWGKYAFVLVACSILLSSTRFSQDSSASGRPSQREGSAYADDADGLRQFLLNALEVAKSGNTEQLQVLIKDTEIPNSEVWFTTTFGRDKGESWAIPYGKMLKENEAHFQENMVRLAHQLGDVSIQKLDSSKVFDTLNGPLDYFLADWNPSHPAKDQPAEPIGYFFFIEGKFRWNSTITFVTLRKQPADNTGPAEPTDAVGDSSDDASLISVAVSGRSGVGYPSCSYCPPAEFPKGKRHLNSAVVVTMKAVIGANGRAAHIEIVKSGGSEFDEKAVEAVRHWRFKPAQRPDGVPVAVTMPIEVAFSN
jgi:TonB family protein